MIIWSFKNRPRNPPNKIRTRQVWDSAAKLPTVTSPKAYFIVALRRELIRRITKQRQFSDATPNKDSELSVEEQLIATQTDDSITESLARFINQLPPRQREIIFLKYFRSLSTEEIADVMELTSPSVYKLLYKALNNLRQLARVGKPFGHSAVSRFLLYLLSLSTKIALP